tara:strand:- start:3720 stop:4430 length:711 start_codon:yes stop_codon:yes gene_type:complete
MDLILVFLISVVLAIMYFFISKNIRKNATYQFIHIPKNAGTAFCKSASIQGLDTCCSNKDWSCHQGAHDKIDSFLKKRPSNTIYITSIRDPYSRFISAFSHYKYKSKRYANEIKGKKFDMTRFTDANDFIQKIISKDKNALRAFRDILFDTQTEYISLKGAGIHPQVKYFLRQEYLDEDMKKLCAKTGVCISLTKDKYEANINTYTYTKLNKTSIEFINENYKRDFMLLPYEMKNE